MWDGLSKHLIVTKTCQLKAIAFASPHKASPLFPKAGYLLSA